MSRSKVLVIHTGGTLGMPAGPGRRLQTSEVRGELAKPLEFIRDIADYELDILVNLDSSDMNPEHWRRLARRIDKARDDFDGVVVIHGTDTLAWSATALSFFITSPPFPIVFTGSQKPLAARRTDARWNLLNAVEVASSGPPEVLVVFNSRILPGCATSKESIFRFDAFRAPNAPTVGQIGLDITWRRPQRRRRKYWCDTRIDTGVVLLPMVPGLDPDIGFGVLERGCRALVIEGFGAGNIPIADSSWVPVLEKARDARIPVVIGSQCAHGRVDPDLYAGARRAHEAGAAFAPGMTREAAVVKAMVMLGRKTTYSKFRREFERDWCGETGEMGVAG